MKYIYLKLILYIFKLMELNTVPLNEKKSQIENTTFMTTAETKNNIETSESIISESNNNKKIKNKFSILIQLMKKNNSTSQIIKAKFNKWKNKTFYNNKIIGKKPRTILIKKKFNLKISKENKDVKEKDKKKIKVFDKYSLDLNEENVKRKKIIKFIEDRITSYISRKDILKKYYNIWLSKAYDIEKIKTNKTIKKKIFKFKINEKEKEK